MLVLVQIQDIISYIVTENNSRKRTATVLIGYTTNGGGIGYQNFYITQNPKSESIEFPIWRDADITFESENDFIDYRLVDDNDVVVYNGKAYTYNGVATIRVNNIIKNFLNESIDLTDTFSCQDNNGYAILTLELKGDNNDFYGYRRIRAYNDWSYDILPLGSILLTEVVSKTMDKRQLFVNTFINRFEEAEETKIEVSGPRDGSTRPYIQEWILDGTISSVVLPADEFYAIYIVIDENYDNMIEYNIEYTCKPFCLYYRQRNGGYSWCLFNRASKQTDTITNYEYTKANNNNNIEFGKTQYLKEYAESWQLKTDWLNDRQSKIFQELLHSNEVYLHLLDENKIIPVVITDTTAEYKLRSNNNKKLINYTVKVENSNKKYIQ